MKNILYKKKQSAHSRRKIVSICECSEDKECKTYVRKNFLYIVTKEEEAEDDLSVPQVFIKKAIDTKNREEKFSFRVKGCFYTSRDRINFKVRFCHSLKIRITWKTKAFSPKSATQLT